MGLRYMLRFGVLYRELITYPGGMDDVIGLSKDINEVDY